MARVAKAGRLLLLLGTLSGCGGSDADFSIGGHRYPANGLTQWALPDELREVSGLALDGAGRLFAHGDEVALIVELDYRQGRAVKRFALGDPPRPGDYEGIAWAGSTLFLVTSDGDLLEAGEADDGGHVDYRLHRTGLGKRCEIEGLDVDADRGLLLMPCKTARKKRLRGTLTVLAWSLQDRAPAPEHDFQVRWPKLGGERLALHPSALTRAANGNLLLAAARQRALLELTPGGELVTLLTLPQDRGHVQMEGIAVTADGDLIIADEGQGARGRLSIYAAAE